MSQLETHFAVIKAHYLPMLRARLPFIVCVLLPVLAVLVEIRRRSKAIKAKGRTADDLRKQLQGRAGLWFQLLKAVRDTVTMAGRGLV